MEREKNYRKMNKNVVIGYRSSCKNNSLQLSLLNSYCFLKDPHDKYNSFLVLQGGPWGFFVKLSVELFKLQRTYVKRFNVESAEFLWESLLRKKKIFEHGTHH